MKSRIYVGDVTHARLAPVGHSFGYPTWVVALDLDELERLGKALWLFGHNRPRPVALHDRDHLGAASGTLRAKLGEWLTNHGVATPRSIRLVTTPRVFGHAFNPVSFYLCEDEGGGLMALAAEVNNTFGEGHVYVLGQPTASPPTLEPKAFHVSPFFDLSGAYEFRVEAAAETLDIRVNLRHGEETVFRSRLRGTARPFDDRTLLRLLLRHPLTHRLTLPRILRQAFALHYRKRLPIHTKPEPTHPATYASGYTPYVSEFKATPRIERFARRLAGTREHRS